MCGIGLIVSGVPIRGPAFSKAASWGAPSHQRSQVDEVTYPDIEDLYVALKRRGPDHAGGVILHVEPPKQHLEVWECSQLDSTVDGWSRDVQTSYEEVGAVNRRIESVVPSLSSEAATRPLPDMSSSARLDFIGATLQLRGKHPVKQPLEDSAGNLLVYNGEVFDGLVVKGNENDGAVLMSTLRDSCGCNCHSSSHLVSECHCADAECHRSVPQVLSQVRGPWALIYWQAVSQTLWFGRDAIGRRSLLIHLPSANDPRLLLTSVAPDVIEGKAGSLGYWEDLACGIYSVLFSAIDEGGSRDGAGSSFTLRDISAEERTLHGSRRQEIVTGWAREHNWEDPWLRSLLGWERQHVTPNPIRDPESLKSGQFCNSEHQDGDFLPTQEGRESRNLSLQRNEYENESSRGCEQNDWLEMQTQKHKVPVEQVLAVLRQAVKRRTIHIQQHWGRSQLSTGKPTSTKLDGGLKATAPVAILFSGGLDSMILAALADHFVDSQCTIDLLNVSFDGDSAPDRITAVAGVSELQGVFPLRSGASAIFIRSLGRQNTSVGESFALGQSTSVSRCGLSGSKSAGLTDGIIGDGNEWRLVKIDAKWSDLQDCRVHLQSLICPSNTYMDLNIGTALWLAASGKGNAGCTLASDATPLRNAARKDELGSDSRRRDSELFSQDSGASSERDINTGDTEGREYYVNSDARVLLVGSGADEQCGGYGRHRTKFRLGGWTALEAEMRLDFTRIWKRNLGRDDRCIADLGKEARFPFLDEDVISTLLSIPLWDIVDLRQPGGVGDKKILRQVAHALGLKGAASLPKRAIQFGSRIAQASNRRDFGSNRAANQASAGSATLTQE